MMAWYATTKVNWICKHVVCLIFRNIFHIYIFFSISKWPIIIINMNIIACGKTRSWNLGRYIFYCSEGTVYQILLRLVIVMQHKSIQHPTAEKNLVWSPDTLSSLLHFVIYFCLIFLSLATLNQEVLLYYVF